MSAPTTTRAPSPTAHPRCRPAALEATTTFEVEVRLSGTFLRGYPATGPSYASGGEPGEPDGVEDIDVEAFTADQLVRTFNRETRTVDRTWRTIDLLAGVDRTNPEVGKLIANIIAYLGDDAETVLLDEWERGA